jgi:hypothetical protein
MHKFIFFLACIIPITIFSQEQLFGSWQGRMNGAKGNYVFNLDIIPNSKEGATAIKGVAIHDRNGPKEVIELAGLVYSDQSVYLSDVSDPSSKIEEGATFSKLQFLFKYHKGELILDGHWQEYEDLHKYRRGRLVLRKKKSKA